MQSPPSDPDESPVRTSGRARNSGPRSEQIVRAATSLFQDAGYRNVSIEQIGAAVGLTGPAVYRHFPGKHDILVQALWTHSDLVEQLTVDADARGTTPSEQLDLFLDGLGDLTVTRDASTLWRREKRHLQAAQAGLLDARAVFLHQHLESKISAVRPPGPAGAGALLSAAVLSVYSNTSGMRGTLKPQRLIEVQRAVADAIVGCTLPPAVADAGQRYRTGRQPVSRRERILDAATQLFSERGFHDVRIGDIARAADVSVATFYQEATSKADVLRTVLWRGVEGILYVSADALTRASDSEALDALVSVFVHYSLGLHGRIMPVFTRDLMYLSEADRAPLLDAQRDYRAEWIAAIRVRTRSLSSADANALAQALFGVTGDIIASPHLRSRPGIVAELTALARVILSPVGLR
ncbi:TetR/AcrR family transcriptional regulator [Gordonia sp. zg691]|uniref:TetR/AcrR family transcriptional regulator n=1 Tax=Gordonia jinghuaiqii TaxID=2758710 RepID=UPI00166264CD|nr:TetR/AcrR family transcriptional regulator [Gordonia jinghuaiqii]MBD0861190.1 TetR/AcrR family transcriptional regulator [Gordonia jinghuaiqii]